MLQDRPDPATFRRVLDSRIAEAGDPLVREVRKAEQDARLDAGLTNPDVDEEFRKQYDRVRLRSHSTLQLNLSAGLPTGRVWPATCS
jgi:hypothetical protein